MLPALKFVLDLNRQAPLVVEREDEVIDFFLFAVDDGDARRVGIAAVVDVNVVGDYQAGEIAHLDLLTGDLGSHGHRGE